MNNLTRALELMDKIMDEEAHPHENYNIIFPILFILEISG